MFTVGEKEIANVQNDLDQAARYCLRVMSDNRSRKLSHESRKSLEQFMFGLMNQKFEIVERVRKRGHIEIWKAMQYVGRAYESLRKADAELGL